MVCSTNRVASMSLDGAEHTNEQQSCSADRKSGILTYFTLLTRGFVVVRWASAEPPQSSAEFFAALRSRGSRLYRHIPRWRGEAGRHTEPATKLASGDFQHRLKTRYTGRTSTSLKPSLADCAATGAAEDAARLTAGTMT